MLLSQNHSIYGRETHTFAHWLVLVFPTRHVWCGSKKNGIDRSLPVSPVRKHSWTVQSWSTSASVQWIRYVKIPSLQVLASIKPQLTKLHVLTHKSIRWMPWLKVQILGSEMIICFFYYWRFHGGSGPVAGPWLVVFKSSPPGENIFQTTVHTKNTKRHGNEHWNCYRASVSWCVCWHYYSVLLFLNWMKSTSRVEINGNYWPYLLESSVWMPK